MAEIVVVVEPAPEIVVELAAAGLPGPRGFPGANGAASTVPGPPGTNGAPGANGTNGTNGAPGRDGTNGVDGAPGTNGTNGAPGVNGAGFRYIGATAPDTTTWVADEFWYDTSTES